MLIPRVSRDRVAAAGLLAAALAAMGFVASLAVRETRQIVETSDHVLRTQRVLTELERVQGSMLWAQGLHRAFVISQQPKYEREFERLLPQVFAQLDKLAAMVSDNKTQLERLKRLRADVNRKAGVIRDSFQLVHAHGYRRAEQVKLLERGTAALESLRSDTSDMEEVERKLLVERVEMERATVHEAEVAEITGTVVAAAFLAASVFVLSVQLRRRREAESQLVAKTRELQRSNEELEQFAYAASHDLQEPLRKVANYAELIERRYQGKLGEEGKRYLDTLVDGAKRMRELINDLLSLSRVRSRPLEPKPVEAQAAFALALANLDEAIREAKARVSASPPLPRGLGGETQLAALFQNLIGNAVKFRAKDRAPVVTVSWRRADGLLEFAVADNGIGISPEYFEKIFLAFHRLHGRGEYPGTGIGLALCKRIVETHGGRLWVDSKFGEGTTFRFTLPAAS